MAKKETDELYDIAFTERDDRIATLENRSLELEEDIEEAIEAFVKAGGDKKLKRGKRKKFTAALGGLR